MNGFDANDRIPCVRMNKNTGYCGDKQCEHTKAYMCQLDCKNVYVGEVTRKNGFFLYSFVTY